MRTAVALRLVVASIAALAADEVRAQGGARAVSPAEREVTRIELAFDAERGEAGGTVLLRIALRDPDGRPAEAPLRVLADGGTVDEPVRVLPGLYTARLALSAVLTGRRALLVIATAGSATASASLPLAPGPPAVLRVELSTDLAADGAPRPLWVTVSDAHGNPTPDAPRAEAQRGRVSEPVSLASGGWMFHYRPPRDTRRGEDVVRLVAGPASRSTTLSLAPMVPVLSVSARGGAVFGTDRPAAAFGAQAATWLETGTLDLGLLLAATWWSTERRATVRVAGGGDLDLRTRKAWLPLTLSAAVRRPVGQRLVASLALGGGAALVASRAALAGQPAVPESGWAPVASAGVELALRQRLGELFAGAEGSWIGDPGLETVRGTAHPVFAYVGYRFHAY